MRSGAVKARPLESTSDRQDATGRDRTSAHCADLEHLLAKGAAAGAAFVAAGLLDAALVDGAVSVLDSGARSAVELVLALALRRSVARPVRRDDPAAPGRLWLAARRLGPARLLARRAGGAGAALARYRARGWAQTPGRVRVPTRYLWPPDDGTSGGTAARGTAAHVAAPYDLVVLDGCGHWVAEQDPRRVVDALHPFR